MAELVACSIVGCSEDVTCIGGIIPVEIQNEGQVYMFCTSFYHINAMYTQRDYLLPRFHRLWMSRRDMIYGTYWT